MYTRILHATDLSSTHFHLSQQALEIALKLDAVLYLLHVIEPPTSLQLAQGLGFAEFDTPVKEDAQAVMRTLGDALNIPISQQFVEIGSIKTHVFEKIEALGCNLLIIGSHTQSHLPALLETSAKYIVESAPCDVLTIKVS
jgi:nucleotide-binding universal stress UspA family protein